MVVKSAAADLDCGVRWRMVRMTRKRGSEKKGFLGKPIGGILVDQTMVS